MRNSKNQTTAIQFKVFFFSNYLFYFLFKNEKCIPKQTNETIKKNQQQKQQQQQPIRYEC